MYVYVYAVCTSMCVNTFLHVSLWSMQVYNEYKWTTWDTRRSVPRDTHACLLYTLMYHLWLRTRVTGMLCVCLRYYIYVCYVHISADESIREYVCMLMYTYMCMCNIVNYISMWYFEYTEIRTCNCKLYT